MNHDVHGNKWMGLASQILLVVLLCHELFIEVDNLVYQITKHIKTKDKVTCFCSEIANFAAIINIVQYI